MMQCERCKNIEATIHLTEIIKDVKSEVHLCESCARGIGVNSKLSNFSLSIPELLSFLDLNEVEDCVDGGMCKSCGLTFMDFSREGKLGCPDCYKYLNDSLKSVILGFHGATRHIGKHPNNTMAGDRDAYVKPVQVISEKKSIEELKRQLNKAVFEERYEEAAVIRDKIREIE
jgi:protein arginine kinase activator